MHILETPRNKPLSNDSFGLATMGRLREILRAHLSTERSMMSPLLELADGIDEF